MNESLRILIVDDDRRMARTLADILRVKGFQAEEAFSGEQALQKIRRGNFDCMLSDIRLPGLNGVELNRAIQKKQPGLPMVLMTAYAGDNLVEKGLQEGAIACLTKPLNINLLLSLLSSLRKETTILIVDDDLAFCHTLAGILKARSYSVCPATNPHQALKLVRPEKQQILLLDMKLKGINGLDLLREVRQRHPGLPVVLVTGHAEETAPLIEAAMALGAHACLDKPLEIEELVEVLQEITRTILSKKAGPAE